MIGDMKSEEGVQQGRLIDISHLDGKDETAETQKLAMLRTWGTMIHDLNSVNAALIHPTISASNNKISNA